MAFESYLTYEEYLELGGTVSEDAFPILERKAQRYVDYLTYNRIRHLTSIPDEVKEVLTDFIDRIKSFESQNLGGEVVTKYSNGVETIAYTRTGDKAFLQQLYAIAKDWLPEYLTNRSVYFDVDKYLQSENNAAE